MKPGATMSPRASNFSSAPPRVLLGRRDFGDTAIAQKDVHGRVDLRRRVDQVTAFDQKTPVWICHSPFWGVAIVPSLRDWFRIAIRSFRGTRARAKKFRRYLAADRADAESRFRFIRVDPWNPWLISPSPAHAPGLPCAWARRCVLRRRSRTAGRRQLRRSIRARE